MLRTLKNIGKLHFEQMCECVCMCFANEQNAIRRECLDQSIAKVWSKFY